MGLEVVEIVMDVEETFGISLPDARISEIRSVGELHECIVGMLGRDLDETTLKQTVLDKLRTALLSATGAAASAIDADTRLSTLLPRFGRRSAWRRLEQSLGLPLPPLVRPRLLNTVGILAAILLGWIAGLSAILALDMPKAGFMAALAAILGLVAGLLAAAAFLFLGRRLTIPLAASWPRGIDTVGDLAQAILQTHYGAVVKQEQRFSRDEVWSILQEIVAGVLGVDRQRVTPEARLVEDLGAG